MPRNRRSNMEIMGDILYAIKTESEKGDIKKTRVQQKSYLAYDHLIKKLKELEQSGLIIQEPLQLTDKGKVFLSSNYEQLKNMLNGLNKEIFHHNNSDISYDISSSYEDTAQLEIMLFDDKTQKILQPKLSEQQQHKIRELEQIKIGLTEINGMLRDINRL